jgi:2-polyprenyl-3-methyl-5-hydroxy-6-metoxy-1,4-benzoquinol methylase
VPDAAIERHIAEGNLWYVGRQLSSIDDPHQSRTIRRRWCFVRAAIEEQRHRLGRERLRVLDAGCGDGVNLAELSRIPDCELSAIDYNVVRVERARAQYPNVRVRQADLTEYEAEQPFDVILCSQVIEHIPNVAAALARLRDALAPGGMLVVGTPNEGCLTARLRNHVFQRSIARTTDHVHFFTEPDLRKRFERAGLVVDDVMRENVFFPRSTINNRLASVDWGFRLMQALCRLFPSQTAGYYFVLRRSGDAVAGSRGYGITIDRPAA